MRYEWQYIAAWVNAAVGLIAGALAAAYLVAHPSWLTGDIAGTCGIIVPITVGLAAMLPPVTRTPAVREAKYLSALAGALPQDVADKHGLSVTKVNDTISVVGPEKPAP